MIRHDVSSSFTHVLFILEFLLGVNIQLRDKQFWRFDVPQRLQDNDVTDRKVISGSGRTTITSFSPRRLNSSLRRMRSSRESGQFVNVLISAIEAVRASHTPSSSLP